MKENPWDKLELGDTIWESDPWNRKVHSRYVARVTTVDVWCGALGKRDDSKSRRKIEASGGMFGFIGDAINSSTWLSKYFPDKDSARRHCIEQHLKYEEERKAQIESEIAELKAQLGGER